MKKQATPEQIKEKVLLAVNSYPTQGVDLKLLVTITREFLHDFQLESARVDVEQVIVSMSLPTRIRAKVKFYYTAETVHNAIRA